MSTSPPWLALVSLESMRPVFWIVMGLALWVTAWRLGRNCGGWPPRVMKCGALMLAIGYAVILPLYDAGILVPVLKARLLPQYDPAQAMVWQVVKMMTMNMGWLLFGLGLALHARQIPAPATPR